LTALFLFLSLPLVIAFKFVDIKEEIQLKNIKMSTTLFDKVWIRTWCVKLKMDRCVFIDRHFIHEVSPVAFLGLKERGISVLYPERTFATADHNTPTINQHLPVETHYLPTN
jgi:3-isopropylmalate/(R)-2-methylmalate dehydratase large subunit